MSNDAIQAIERNIKKAREVLEFSSALERLRGSRDFKKVVLEGYFEQEAIRLVHLKADQNMQKPETQQSIVNQIDAIGQLSQFFSTALQKAAMASRQIEADQETIEEIAGEELNNG
jgi:hypothetical protein